MNVLINVIMTFLPIKTLRSSTNVIMRPIVDAIIMASPETFKESRTMLISSGSKETISSKAFIIELRRKSICVISYSLIVNRKG